MADFSHYMYIRYLGDNCKLQNDPLKNIQRDMRRKARSKLKRRSAKNLDFTKQKKLEF